jgi:hypothetical protein
MKKLLKLLILNFTLLLFLHIPSYSFEINKDLKLLDLTKINNYTCQLSGTRAISLNNKFSEFIQGYKFPTREGGGSKFVEDNVSYLNQAFSGNGSDKDDEIFKKRFLDLANSNSFKKIDWEGKGGSSPSFVTTIVIKSIAYSIAYLKSKNKLNKNEIDQISNYIKELDKNTYLTSIDRFTSKQGGNVAIDQRFSRGTALMLWGAAINDKVYFMEGYNRYFEELKTLDKRQVFSKNLRHNNETIHHVIQGAEVLRLNGFNIYNMDFKKGTLRSHMESHTKNLLKNNNKKIKTSGDMTAKAESIVRTTGYGAHVAWIPFYLNDPENKTENIEKLNEMALGNSVNEYYGQQLAIHSGCLYGKNYFSPY